MAQAVPYIGYAIGAAFGTGTFLGVSYATWGFLAGSLLLSATQKGPNQQGPRLDDRSIIGTAYGQAIPWVAGSPRLAGQIIWASPLREIANTQKSGKGGSSKYTTFTYECDVMIMLTENVTQDVARDWINAELVRRGITLKSGVWDSYTVYTGEDDQLPDPTYESHVGVGNAPAYRGHTTIVIRSLQLFNGKQIPNLEHQPSIGTSIIELGDFQDGQTLTRTAPGNISASAASPESDDTFLASVGKWSNSYDTTVVDVFRYTFSADLWSFVNSFSVPLALENCSKGNADAAYRVAIGSHSAVGRVYLLPSGARRYITRGSEAASVASQNVVYLISGETMWHAVGTANPRIYKNSISFADPLFPAPIDATSAPMVGTMNGMAERNGFLYVATRGGGNIQVYAAASLEFIKTIDTGFEGGGMLIGSVDGRIVAVCRHVDGLTTYPVFTLGNDDEIIPIGFATAADVELSGGGSARGLNGNRGSVVITNYSDSASPRVYSIRAAAVERSGEAFGIPQPLNETLRGLLLRAGYAEEEFDVQGLAELPLHGYATGEISGTRAHLETLRPFGKYEAYCTDKLYIFPRATVPAGSVAWEDLGASEGGEPGEPFPLQQGNESELPAQIALRYRNVTAAYNIGTEVSDRLISSQQSTQTVEMGFGMTPSQAKSVVSSMLLDLMAGLGRVTIQVGGRKYAKFNPGDIITVTNPQGRTYRLRILTKRDSIVWIEWDCVLDDASVLNPPDETYDGYVSNADPVMVAPTAWETVAIPALRDADAIAPGPYVAITPARTNASDEWPGAVFVRARLPEAYEQEFITGDAAVLGATTSTLPAHDRGSYSLQRTGKVVVEVRGELSSSTWGDFFLDRTINACVIGNEPMRFMRADFVSTDGVTNIYELSLFMRGQLGQEHEIVEHLAGTRFVLLNNSMRRMVNETTDIGVEQQLKATTLNTLLSSVVEEDFTESGIVLKPYSVWSLKALADGADLDVTWRRRSRLVARYTDAGTFTPLGEASEQYRVKVYDDPDADPVRTVDLSTAAWAYLAADITSDGFTSGDPITITVQQLSDLVGEGFATTVETSAP